MELNLSTLQAIDLVNTGSRVEDVFRDIVFSSLKKLRIIEGRVRNIPYMMPLIKLVSPLYSPLLLFFPSPLLSLSGTNQSRNRSC